MPFLLYSTAGAGGSKNYERLNGFSLAGSTNGLIRRALNAKRIQNGDWILDRSDLLTAGGHDPATRALVIDTTPRRTGEGNLLEIMRIAGRSESGWVPLMLILDTLLDDNIDPEHSDEQKRSFKVEPTDRVPVITFLYLREDWNWGRVGAVNGALLWPDAFAHFVKVAGMAHRP